MKYYVDAAAQAGGDGSENKPFNKIQQAADNAVRHAVVKTGTHDL